MFQGLGAAERRLLLILRAGVPVTVTDAHRVYPDFDYRVHRQAMQSLARKGFVQTIPGPVFAIGVACKLGEGVIEPRDSGRGRNSNSLREPKPPLASPLPAAARPRPAAMRSSSSRPAAIGSSSSRPAIMEPRPATMGPPPAPIPQPQAAFNYASAADAYAAKIAPEVEKQKRKALKNVRAHTR
jgi:hypothetical protein